MNILALSRYLAVENITTLDTFGVDLTLRVDIYLLLHHLALSGSCSCSAFPINWAREFVTRLGKTINTT